MRTMSNSEANRKCNCSGIDLVGQVLIGGEFNDAIAVEDTLTEAVEAARKLGADITEDDVDCGNNQTGMDSDTLYAWTVIAD